MAAATLKKHIVEKQTEPVIDLGSPGGDLSSYCRLFLTKDDKGQEVLYVMENDDIDGQIKTHATWEQEIIENVPDTYEQLVQCMLIHGCTLWYEVGDIWEFGTLPKCSRCIYYDGIRCRCAAYGCEISELDDALDCQSYKDIKDYVPFSHSCEGCMYSEPQEGQYVTFMCKYKSSIMMYGNWCSAFKVKSIKKQNK